MAGTVSTDELLQVAFREQMKGVHTMLPGVIEEFDAATQMAKIQLANKIQLVDGTMVDPPALTEVPVQFQQWGGYSLTMPVSAGDECAVIFSERSLSRFKELGSTDQPPTEARYFTLSDGFAIPGLTSKPNAISGFSVSAMELRDSAGTTKLTLSDDGTVQITNGSVSYTIDSGGIVTITNGTITFTLDGAGVSIDNGTAELVDMLSQTLQQLSIETVTPASPGVPVPLNGAAIYTNLKTLVDSLKL